MDWTYKVMIVALSTIAAIFISVFTINILYELLPFFKITFSLTLTTIAVLIATLLKRSKIVEAFMALMFFLINAIILFLIIYIDKDPQTYHLGGACFPCSLSSARAMDYSCEDIGLAKEKCHKNKKGLFFGVEYSSASLDFYRGSNKEATWHFNEKPNGKMLKIINKLEQDGWKAEEIVAEKSERVIQKSKLENFYYCGGETGTKYVCEKEPAYDKITIHVGVGIQLSKADTDYKLRIKLTPNKDNAHHYQPNSNSYGHRSFINYSNSPFYIETATGQLASNYHLVKIFLNSAKSQAPQKTSTSEIAISSLKKQCDNAYEKLSEASSTHIADRRSRKEIDADFVKYQNFVIHYCKQ